MNQIDALLAGAHALTANHTAVDTVINAGLLYGPGVLATAAAVTAWRSGRWALNQAHRRADERARRKYTATATRLHQVADNTDRIITAAGDQLAEQLLHQIYANDTEGEK